jgi:phosphatidylglycerophosphatase A
VCGYSTATARRSASRARGSTIFASKGGKRPAVGFLFRHPAHFVALGGGTGLSPLTPGTFGSLLALGIFFGGARHLDPIVYAISLAAWFAVGVWACEITGRALGHGDHGAMVWDEVVAYLLVLPFVPLTVEWQIAAFVLFRIFDIAKPPPIRYFERTVKGGFGVMFDDVLAAGYTLLVLAIARHLLNS